MKHSSRLNLIVAAFAFLFPFAANAQPPTVLTRNASAVSSSPANNPNTFIYATLHGIVNAGGGNCAVSFEYGNTTSYGYTATVGTVTGSSDVNVSAAVTLNYTFINFEQHKEINYRLVVTNANGTFYGRNYIATPFDATRKIQILANCSDNPTMAVYDLKNCNNNIDVTVNYTGGTYSGPVIIGSYQEQQIYVEKNNIAAFYYQNNIFKQIVTNNQLCSETETPEKKILVYTLGRLTGDYSQLYKIENRNTYPVTVSVQIHTETYTQTIPANSAAYVAAGGLWNMQIAYNETPFAYANYSIFEYEEPNWLDITAVSSTYTTATFELYNRDDVPHTYVLRNAAGTEHSYNVSAHQSYLVTLPNEVWNVLISVYDINATEWNSTGWGSIRAGETFGDPAYAINGKLKIATAIPATVITLMPTLTSLTQNSLTSFTANGTITGNASQSTTVDYHFIYGTNPDNLNLTTSTQQVTIPANQDANVEATINGLEPGTSYYVKLVVGANESTIVHIFLPAESGNALNFDGSNDYISIPDNDATISTAFTIETWILWQPNSNTDIQFICGKAGEQMELHTGGSVNNLRFIPTTGVYLDAANVLPVGHWAHIACVYDATNAIAKMYINGDEVALTNHGAKPIGSALQNTAIAFCLGSRGDGTYFFKGSLDEFRLWNRILTQTEIRQNFTTSINPALQSGLVSYYNFNDGIAAGNNSGTTTLFDLTNTFNGTLNNFTLNGTTSNWVESYAMVIPQSVSIADYSATHSTINWTAPQVGTVDNYLMYVATDSTFTNLVSGYTPKTFANTVTTETISGLDPTKNYYCRICTDKSSVTGQGAFKKIVAITHDYSVSTNSLNFGSNKDLQVNFTINTMFDWQITGIPSWFTASANAGTGNATITLTAEPNTGFERFATIMVNGAPIAVRQNDASSELVKTLTPYFNVWTYYFGGSNFYGFSGSVNPQGQTYTVYFEYGTDENFGYTTPLQTVSGSTTVGVSIGNPLDAFLSAYGGDIFGLTIHYRLVAVDASSNKFYGRDVPFSVNYIYNSQKIEIWAVCSDSGTNALFEVKNTQPQPITVTYQSLERNGSLFLGPNILQNAWNVYKYSVTSFYLNGVLFKQVIANNQYCSEDPAPDYYIQGYSMGTINNGTGSVYILLNHNTIPVDLAVYSGTSVLNITIPAGSYATFVTPTNDVEVDYGANALFVLSTPQKEYGPVSLLRVVPVCTDDATATFEIQNNDNVAHEFILTNASNTYTYSLAANSYQMVSLPKNNYDVYANLSFTANLGYTATIDNHYKLYSVGPGSTSINISKTSVILPFSAGTETFRVSTASPTWAASSDQSWLSLDKTSGTCGNSIVKIIATPNLTTSNRTAIVIISNGASTATFTVTQFGNTNLCLNFDNTLNNLVSVPFNDNALTNAFTIETWVMQQQDGLQFICGKEPGQMEIHTNTGGNIRFIPTTGVYIDATHVLPLNRWTHVAVVYSSAESLAKIYVNGNEVPVVNNGTNPLTTPLVHSIAGINLGRRSDGSYYFKGSLDEFRIWNRALTQTEIRQNMNMRIAVQTGLICYFGFDYGNAGANNTGFTTLFDQTGSFNSTLINFTLTGTTSNWVESYAMVVPTAVAATNITTTGFTANWMAPIVGEIDNYLLDVATDVAFNSQIYGSPFTIPYPATTYSLSGLQENTIYYYRVRANKNIMNNQGANSATMNVETSFITANSDIENVQRLSVFPNPNKGQFTLSVSCEYLGDVYVDICNTTGSIVQTLKLNKNLITQNFNIKLLDQLNKGFYILSIKTNKTQTRTLIVN